MRLRLKTLGLVTLISIGFARWAPAQLCFGPDGLQGGCCSHVTENLPAFPGFQLEATGICWSQCDPIQTSGSLSMGALNLIRCGAYQATVVFTDAAGNDILSGLARLDYTRTWEEVDTSGNTLQVWRLLTKIELTLGPSPQSGCPTPPCLLTHSTAFFTGYTDFALDCAAGTFESSSVLFHACDKFIHDSRHSSRPGVFHPGESFALVAPHTSATPFTPSSSLDQMAPISGLGAGAFRSIPQGTPRCVAEEPVPSAPLGLIGQACACPLDLTRNGASAQVFSGGGTCPDSTGRTSSFASLNTFTAPLLFPWFHMITHNIGTWSGGPGGQYPGPEEAFVNEGWFRVYDACAEAVAIELSYGSLTQNGYTVNPDSQRPWQSTNRFLDMASNFSKTQGIKPPFTGEVRDTRHLYYSNPR